MSRHQRINDDIQKLPNGARFYRCALQVNPHHYRGTFRGQAQPFDEQTYIREVIAKALEQGIEVLAITDHNHGGAVDRFRVEAAGTGISIIPGFEVTSREGIHVLCLYPLDTAVEELNRYLGALGILDTEPSTTPAPHAFGEILEKVEGQGGLTIAAHVTQEHGLLKTLRGAARAEAWRDPHLLAVQIPGPVRDLPPEYQQIVRNRDPAHRRERPRAPDLAVAVVNARDVEAPGRLEDEAASCWIKMSEVSLEGLKQAFLDPQSRIRLSSDEPEGHHAELVGVTWEGGFLDGLSVHFNSNLNVLIGGRGAGKSTLIESLRYVLQLEPLGDEARSMHERMVRGVLESGTKITLFIRSWKPDVREYRIERIVPEPPVVMDAEGAVQPLRPADLLPGIECYGQHEISELTSRPDRLTRLLERFQDREEDSLKQRVDLRRGLERTRTRILDLRKELAEIDERLSTFPGLEQTLQRYKEAGLEERLREQTLLVREESILKVAEERLAPFQQHLEGLRGSLPIDQAFVSETVLQELPGRDFLRPLALSLQQLDAAVSAVAAGLEQALGKARADLRSTIAGWQTRQKQVTGEYQRILRELQTSKVDGEAFIRLRRQLEGAKPLQERRASLVRELEEANKLRQALLAEWEETRRRELEALVQAAKKVSRRLEARVRVEVEAAGNREPLDRLLRERVRGRLHETLIALKNHPALSIPELVAACRQGKDELVRRYKLTQGQAENLVSGGEELFLDIEELDLPAVTRLELNVGSYGEPDWRNLDELSVGQKATAILLLLLLDSDAPLIVDQPEDDLDNRFITEGVVPKVREIKRTRQVIFATHNANIPVLGDAELILGLSVKSASGRTRARIRPEDSGSIDSVTVRRLVSEVLEGGRAAFERRREKYGY